MDTIGVGVVGCGFVGRGAHVPAFKAIEGARLVAVADPDEKRRNKAVTKHQVPSAYADYGELIQDPAVQLVVVAVPTPLHAEVSLAAIEAGKHVLCEMPLAVSLEDADRMIQEAEKQGVQLLPGLTFRFTPNFVKVKQLIAEGAIGKPVALSYRELIPASDLAGQWPAGGWMWDLPRSGGPLFTLAVWSIDLVRWLLDTEIKRVEAVAGYTRLDQLGGTLGYDAIAAIQLENGAVASLRYSGSVNRAAADCGLEVIGDATHVLRATDNDRVQLLADDPTRTEWNVKQPGPAMWGHLQQDEYFIGCLREGRTPEFTAADGRRAMEVAHKIASATQ